MICVPTPLSVNREPELGPLLAAAESLAAVLRRDQLVVLESTTYPRTTRETLVPILERSGLRAGEDFGVAFGGALALGALGFMTAVGWSGATF